MDKSIRVRLLDRDFGLRVKAETEPTTREIAAYVDARMRAFKRKHPDQSELTSAVITALAIAEELYACREQQDHALGELDGELAFLDQQLAIVLEPSGSRREAPPGLADPKHDSPHFEAGV